MSSTLLADWDSKPWALHPGAFTWTAARALLHGLCDGAHSGDRHLHLCRVRGDGENVPAGDLPWSEGQAQGDPLHHPEEREEGDTVPRPDKVGDLPGNDSVRQQLMQAKTCKVVSLGVLRGYLGQRIGRLRPQDIHDNEAIRVLLSELWNDYFDDETTFHCPQPGHDKVLYIVVDFLPLHDILHLGRVACLINVIGRDSEAEATLNLVEAALLPERATWWGIIFELELREQCRSRTGNQCLLRVGRRLILTDDPFVIPDRAAIAINYDISEDEPMRVSLLQTQSYVKVCPGQQHACNPHGPSQDGASSSSRSLLEPTAPAAHRPAISWCGTPNDGPDAATTSQSPSSRTYHLFHRATDYQVADIDASDPFQERTQIAAAWNVAPDVGIGIHPVQARPADFPDDGSIIAITRWVQDAELRAYPTDIQVLFDIEIHSGVAPSVDVGPKLFRHVDWSRRTMTRDGYLHALRVKDYCHILAGDTCLVWHNNRIWPIQDVQQRDIRAGDYIRIAIPARGGQTIGGARRVLEISEEQARDHIIFEPSPAESSSDEAFPSSDSSTRYGPPEELPEPEPFANVEVYDKAAWCEALNVAHRSPRPLRVIAHGLYLQPLGFHEWIYDVKPTLSAVLADLIKEWEFDDLYKYRLHHVDGPILNPTDFHVVVEITPVGLQPLPGLQPRLVTRLVESFDGKKPFFEFGAAYTPTEMTNALEISPTTTSSLAAGYPFNGAQLQLIRDGLFALGLAPLRIFVHSINSDCIDHVTIKEFPRELLSFQTVLHWFTCTTARTL